jgi:hypothetical protein
LEISNPLARRPQKLTTKAQIAKPVLRKAVLQNSGISEAMTFAAFSA